MIAIAFLFLCVLRDCFKSRRRLDAAILVLRHQLNVLQRRAPRRLHLRWVDRALFIWLYRRCLRILDATTIVKPEAVVRWHRMGFASYAVADHGSASTFAESLRNMPSLITRCERMFRSGRTRPAHALSSDSETLLRIRSLAGYIAVRNDFDKRRRADLIFG